jgi:segregation and condensation protein B
LIFASGEEITLKEIKEILTSFHLEIELEEIEEIIKLLNEEYEKNDNAFRIINIAGGYLYSTRKEFAQYVGKLYSEIQKKKLSQSAIETLAIISYRQPVTRSEIEFIRGVNVDYIVNSLLERDLIKIIGRENTTGRPILYGTTQKFLKVLGISSLKDLPRLKEINEILKTEKLEGITEADIDLFNSVNNPEMFNPNEEESIKLSDDTSETNTGDTSQNNTSGLSEYNETQRKDIKQDFIKNDEDDDKHKEEENL